ncbi:phospholipase-like protein [Tanacetum coccineum]
MAEGVEYMTDDEVVMSEQEESNHGYTQNIQHFKEKDDVDEWLNTEITKHMSMQGVENMKDALISIIKSIRQEMKDGIMKNQFEASTASVSNEVSFIASNEVDRADDNTPNIAPYAKDNFMPQRVYEYIGIDKLRDTSTLENTTGTNEHLGTVNILVKFEELEFSCNFVIKMPEYVIILGRPFLESTRAQINIFNEEISFEIGSKKFKFNIDSYQNMEKIYMVDIAQEKETFNPQEIGIDLFSYESPACLDFEQRTKSYYTPNPKDEIAKPISFSPDRRGLVKRWHVCKPIHVAYDDGSGEDCGTWPTCDPDSKFCFGYNEVFGVNEQGSLRMWISFRDHERRTVKGSYMGFGDFLQVRYGRQKINDTIRERMYYEWVAQNYEFIKHQTLTLTNLNDHYPYNTNDPIPTPQGHREQGDDELRLIRPRPYNYSFEECLNMDMIMSRAGLDNNEWILDSYDVEEEYTKEIGNPYSRRFDEYNRVFSNEIEHLSNEYILRIEKKGYVLDDVWEKCQQNYKKINEAWHDEGYEEDEMWRSGDEKTDYNPPYDEALPLGHVNGARFKAMIRKELEGNKIQKLGGNSRDRIDSYTFGNLAEFAVFMA